MDTPRLLRFVALAVSAATLIWLTGCSPAASDSGEPSTPRLSLAEQMEQRTAETTAGKQAAAEQAASAKREAVANEQPSEISKSDFKRGSKLQGGGAVSTALGGVLRAGEDVQLKNIQHQLTIHGEGFGYPKSHQAFMDLMKEWGMKLPPLDGPYEYWYNAETRKILKRPIVPPESSEGSTSK